MFSVWGKRENRLVTVYDVTYDAVTGYPQFLIYDEGAWRRVSAKHYEPQKPSVEDLVRRYISDSRPIKAHEAFEALEKSIKDQRDDDSDWKAYCCW